MDSIERNLLAELALEIYENYWGKTLNCRYENIQEILTIEWDMAPRLCEKLDGLVYTSTIKDIKERFTSMISIDETDMNDIIKQFNSYRQTWLEEIKNDAENTPHPHRENHLP